MKKTIEQIKREQCTGCGVCAVRCPKGSISMVEDEEGFRFPVLDPNQCVECGMCESVCPTTKAADGLYSEEKRSYFCGIIHDKELLEKSSSGGMFGVLAKHVIEQGGFVCGCVYDDNMEAVHLLSNRKSDIERMYGSKYVQSRAEHCFPEIQKLLRANDKVLFTGTACQVAALRIYLGKDYRNLYCVEILCHGVPSPGLFRTYKQYLEKKLGGEIRDIRFRDKRRDGWGSEHRTCVIYEKHGKLREYRPTLPAYFSAFFYGLDLRESCYHCRFARVDRVADLTMGDYWGSWEKYGKRFNEGISVLAVSSKKGSVLKQEIEKACIFFEPLTQAEATLSNDNFDHPVKYPLERSGFYTNQAIYDGLWKKVYLTKTYRRKTLQSFYGALVPARLRFVIHNLRGK